jgi:hypothetical protein
VKLICLKLLLVANVGTDAPDVRLRLSLDANKMVPVVPKLNVLVTDIPVEIFDVPVNVKFVASAIDRTVVAAVVVVRTIDPVVPNAIALVLVLLEPNMPVLSVKLFRSNVPLVNVVVLVAPTVIAS